MPRIAPASAENAISAPVLSRCSRVMALMSSVWMLGGEIDHLPTDHALRARRGGQRQHQIGAHLCIAMRRGVGEHFEGARQQPVAGEDRRGFVVFDMRGGTAAAQIVIVHRRQIVMHQAVAMHHLDGAGDAQRAVLVDAEELGALHHQEGPQPLAAAQRRIAHRLEHAAFERVAHRQQRVEHRLQRGGGRGHGFFEGSRHGMTRLNRYSRVRS